MVDVAPTLRERARGAVREEVMRQAWILFSRHGYAATTIEQVVEASGMSRRTFFRYFSGKDELLLERLLDSAHDIADTLRQRPDDEPAWPALRAAFAEPVRAQQANPAVSRPVQLMLREEDDVRAAVQEWQRRLVELLSPLVAARLPSDEPALDVRARAVAASATACLHVAQEAWATSSPDVDLAEVLDAAMSAVAPLHSPRDARGI